MSDATNGSDKPSPPPEAASDAAEGTSAPPAAAPAAATPPASAESEQIAALTAERDRLKDGLLRSLADFDNFRKRARRDTDEAVRKAREDLLRELLPVFDNLERAAQYVGTGADPKAIGKGIEMVLRLFDETLVKVGGKRLKSVGQPFDPQHHEAIQQVESAEFPSGTVAREELPGYLFNDRLLRPAMVVVSRGAPAASASASGGEDGAGGDRTPGDGGGGSGG